MYIIKEKRSQNQCPNLPSEETSKLMIGNQQNKTNRENQSNQKQVL